MENLEKISEEFSFDKEKEIARSFSKRFQWEMVLIGVGQATIWLSLWPLVINGHISLKMLGSKGFGYDPVFIPKGSKLTFGQMNPQKKMKIDHRSIAFKKLKRKLKPYKFFI